MPQVHRSPLTDQDLDALEAVSRKANAQALDAGHSPLFIAIDVGGADQRDGYLLLCWPALNSRAAHSARLIFDFIVDVARAEFGAVMVPTVPQEAPDARKR